MNVYAISALVNVATSVVLGLLILLADKRAAVNRTFALFAASVAFWSYSYFAWQIETDAGTALFWTHLLMLGATFITPVYYHFCCYFLGIEREQRFYVIAGYFLAIVFALLNWSPLYITGIGPALGFDLWPQAGPLFAPFLVFWIAYAIYPVILLLRAIPRETPDRVAAIKFILAGTIIGYAGGCTNYFLWYAIPVLPFGNISASIYLALVAYAIMQHRLFNMKVIATELLIFSLWLLVFVRLLLADTTADQLIEGGLLAVLLVVGVLLIRSVDKEVEQRERIEQLSNEKSEFMTFASHEIRNPITAMRGFASLIVDGTTGDVNAKTKDAAEKIFVTGNEVLMLISTFLNKSKMELGQIQYNMSPFDLGAAVGVIADGYAPHATQKGLQLVRHIDPSQKFMVIADEGKVKEVIGNIIDNSLKYTKQGSLTVAVERHGVATRVVISDTGVGIPPEVLPHLFKKFSRADAQKVNLLGTGVGLYLAKTFIEGMKGRIWAESEGTGKGSRFIIEFPTAS